MREFVSEMREFVSEMREFVSETREFVSSKFEELLAARDSRVEKWPFVESPITAMNLVILYLTITLYGPALMRHRKAMDLKWLLIVYNTFLVIVNSYICVEVVLAVTAANYDLLCPTLDFSTAPEHMRVARVSWWFYFTKIIEFFDTVFFIVRKKNDQLTFLHVFHHVTMFINSWAGLAWLAAGATYMVPLINSFVHVLMYLYYVLSAIPACRPYLWWKAHLTKVQLSQFAVCVIFYYNVYRQGCNYPSAILIYYISYAVIIALFFINFYFQAYLMRRRLAPTSYSVTNPPPTPKQSTLKLE